MRSINGLWDNLLVRFSVVSLIVLGAIAMTIAMFVSDRMRDDAIRDVVRNATLDTRLVALGALTPADFEGPMEGERFYMLDEFVHSSLLTEVTAMVKLWSGDGTLIYSSDPVDPSHEERLPTPLSLAATARLQTSDESSATGARHGDLMRIYIPVVFPGAAAPLGALEIYQRFEPTAQRIDEMRTWVFLVTGLGFIGLYITLVTIVWGATNTISHQRSALAGANAELQAANQALLDAHDELESRIEARTAELVNADEQVRESEERFRSVFQDSAVGMALADRNGRFVQVNQSMTGFLGYAEQELFSLTLRDITFPGEADQDCLEVDRIWTGESDGFATERRYLHKDGHVVWGAITVSPVRDAEGMTRYTVGQIRDITQHKQLESQLVHSQKMEVVGRLAGGVAHDFNNLLTPIMGFAHLGVQGLRADHPVRGYLNQIQEAAGRGAELVRQLLAFSRRQMAEPGVVKLNDLVANVERMLGRLVGEDIELVCRLAPDLGTVKVDAGQMEQVLVNLSVNARDAMPDGGTLIIETANVALDNRSAQEFAELGPGQYVRLSVSDTGAGMEEEVRAHLFEPFFTTKEPGKGTGLGLATCYGIVRQGGGDIRVWSQPGKWTTFEIYLPRVEETATPVAESRDPGQMPRGAERVLLVEDEPAVRRLAAEVLRRQGYTVLEAADGQEALRVAQECHGKGIDLLLSDMVMPHMGGRELADRLKALMPHMNVILTSGFLGEKAVPDEDWGDRMAFIPKPFTPGMMALKVREVLDGSPADH